MDEQLARFAPWVDVALAWGAQLLKAFLILAIGWTVSRWARRLVVGQVERQGLDLALGKFLATVLQWAVLAATAIAALGTVGIETASLVALFASAGVAIGLALQGSLSNFASGVLLLVFRPFDIKDVVTISGRTGTVEEIGLFATRLITPENHRVIVPNSQVTGNDIVNLTALPTRRADVLVGVAYGSDPERVVAVLRDAARSCSRALQDPEPVVWFSDLGASAIEFRVYAWARTEDWWWLVHELRTACYAALTREGIEIPFPQVVVHGAEQLAAK